MNARKINDTALEWLIVVARVGSVVYLGLAFTFLVAAALLVKPGLAFGAGVLMVAAAFTGWFGWWQFGNAEWRPAKASRKGLCPAVRPLVDEPEPLVCNVQVDANGRHRGMHWDSVRDPRGEWKWG